jgi:hypothetical protein
MKLVQIVNHGKLRWRLVGVNKGVLKIVVAYSGISCIWILASDTIVEMLTSEPGVIRHISVIKGLLFVVITAVLLYTLIKRYIGLIEK